MDEYYTEEHERVAAIINVQWRRANSRDPNAMLLTTRFAREAINGILIDLAVMYRDQERRFDFPRFLRECRENAE